MDLDHQVKFYTVKTIAIVFVTVLYFIFGYLIAKSVNTFCDYIFGVEYEKLSQVELGIQIIFQIAISYFISRLVKKFMLNKLPYPLEGVAGFKHSQLKELVSCGGIAWVVGIFLYQKSLKEKINIFRKNISV
jgi:hypothetical protein